MKMAEPSSGGIGAGDTRKEQGQDRVELGTQSNFTPQVKMQLSAATERLQPNDDDDDDDDDVDEDEDDDDDGDGYVVVTIKTSRLSETHKHTYTYAYI